MFEVLSLFHRGIYWEERQKMYSLQDDDESLMVTQSNGAKKWSFSYAWIPFVSFIRFPSIEELHSHYFSFAQSSTLYLFKVDSDSICSPLGILFVSTESLQSRSSPLTSRSPSLMGSCNIVIFQFTGQIEIGTLKVFAIHKYNWVI